MESRLGYNNSIRTDEELHERVANRQNYMPETVETALAELKKRGHEFSDEEIKVIDEDLQAHRQNAALVSSRIGIFSSEYKNVIVSDPDAPQLYSRLAVYIFTVFMGVLFGSIMMAINIAKTEKKALAFWAVLFGIGLGALQIFILLNFAKGSTGSYQIICGLISAFFLDYFFWTRFIGYATFYRARPIWIPLIIALVLVALLIFSTASVSGNI